MTALSLAYFVCCLCESSMAQRTEIRTILANRIKFKIQIISERKYHIRRNCYCTFIFESKMWAIWFLNNSKWFKMVLAAAEGLSVWTVMNTTRRRCGVL